MSRKPKLASVVNAVPSNDDQKFATELVKHVIGNKDMTVRLFEDNLNPAKIIRSGKALPANKVCEFSNGGLTNPVSAAATTYKDACGGALVLVTKKLNI